MDTHVKELGALQVAFGAIGVMLALPTVFESAALPASSAPAAIRRRAFAVPIIGLTGTALVAFLAVTSLPGVVIGIGLLRFCHGRALPAS